jgi:hypothetical protein
MTATTSDTKVAVKTNPHLIVWTNHQHRRWSMVRVLSANCLGTDASTNANTFTIQMAVSGIDSIDSTKSHNNQNPAQYST